MTSLEALLGGRGFAGLPLSRVQRAFARAADGLPIGDELDDDAVSKHFGCERSRIGLTAPVIVAIVAGVRAGKSFFAACGALRDVLAADVSALRAHEIPRHVIVAPTSDNASATFRILTGIIDESPILRAMRVGDPTADTLTIRRPDGRVFEIVVVAAHRGAITLRSRWLAGATLEEVAGFGVESAGAAINAEALLRAAETRLLPGTQARLVSSPFGREGLLWRLYKEHFGKPGRVLVMHAATRDLNPSFPQATIDAVRARDPDAAAREYDAKWIDGALAFFDSVLLTAARRSAPLARPPRANTTYFATMDAATRGNAWTVAVSCQRDDATEVAAVGQWIGSREEPLKPAQIFREMASFLSPYRVTEVHGDAWSVDALRDSATLAGLSLIEHGTADRDAGYLELRTRLQDGRIELPPDDQLDRDLRGVRRILTPRGQRIDLPLTADGRHCDFAPTIALAALVTARAQSFCDFNLDPTYDDEIPRLRV